jgi:hypothetical protein
MSLRQSTLFLNDTMPKLSASTHAVQAYRANLSSDWEILNNAKVRYLNHVAAVSSVWTDDEIQQACALLESYHAVYRPDLMQLRAGGYRGQCPLPTAAQLQRIAQQLQNIHSPEQILCRLQAIAQCLR